MYSFLTIEKKDRVAWITLNRPDKSNALNAELIAELTSVFEGFAIDGSIKVIVLKANGNVFSAGADLAYLHQLQHQSVEENVADTERLKDLFQAIYLSPKVTIAQVEGHAIAGGCGLATVCDIVFAVPEAKFGYSEVKIGFIPALVACYLVQKIGSGRAGELLLSGNLITAETAERYGLISFVVAKDQIVISVQDYVRKLCTDTAAGSIKLTKQLLRVIQNKSLEEALQLAVKANADARTTDDFKNGLAAFLNGDKQSW